VLDIFLTTFSQAGIRFLGCNIFAAGGKQDVSQAWYT